MATIRAKWRSLAALGSALPHARELAIVVVAYWAYMYTRSLVFNDSGATALDNAASIISLERSLGFFWEPQWQEWVVSVFKALVLFFNWVYIVTFWPILLVTGVILYVINRQRYRYYRNLVLLSFVLALLGFMLFPLAPPRMISDQFVDTIKVFGPAFYASREFANFYNPYAAMPSLHFSWTLMFGILFMRTSNRWLRIFGVIYPTMTFVAITVTANHYILDAVGGGLLMLAAYGALELGFRRRLFLPRLWASLGAWARSRGLPTAGAGPAAHSPGFARASRPGPDATASQGRGVGAASAAKRRAHSEGERSLAP